MELRNRTHHPAGYFNTVIGKDELLASVVVRATYCLEDKLLALDLENPVPVDGSPITLPEGELDGEQPFLRNGVDLFVFGHAYAPDEKPTQQLKMTIQAGQKFTRQILITGDRVWKKEGEEILPSDMQPFVKMPLSYMRAYGGKSLGEAGEMAYSANPDGRGFYLVADQAIGNPLPNLEDPEKPVTRWEDQPSPLSTGPYSREWALRMLNSVELTDDPEKPGIKRLKPEYFNNAHPAMIIYDPLTTGDVITISHLRPEGSLRFELPDINMHVHVQLEDRHFLFPLHLESIGILGDENQIFFSCRVAFKYEIIPLERRVATLHPGKLPESFPEEYAINWEKQDIV